MKFSIYFLFLFTSLFYLNGCKKHAATPAVDQLPAETQKGANTFGCLVNGNVFKPGGLSLTPTLQCNYIVLNGTNSLAYFFEINATDNRNPEDFPAVVIATDSLQIKGVGIISLANRNIKGKAFAEYARYKVGVNPTMYDTNDFVTGELNIKKIDTVQQIVAATFWFNAVNTNGDTVKITNGRFDIHYTR